MININSEKELVSFLKILTEESVKKSKRILKEEEDPFSSYYSKKRKKEKELFEQEDSPPEKPPGMEIKKDKPVESEAGEQETPKDSQSSEESFVGSKDRLVDFVNDIRSAPSIKDSAVSDQIDAYYDRLSQEEKDVLVFFLRELSRVMTGKAAGIDARDPSDPPLNIDFVHREKSPDTKDQKPEDPSPPTPEPEETEVNKNTPDTDSDEEDTSPPIKVNESQDHRMLRAKIKRLIG